jgi:hypothetical protein
MDLGAVEETRLPQLLDSSGYETTRREIDFVGISEQDLADVVERRRPLGMTVEQWDRCQAELEDAIAKDGIDDHDVRIQGTGAHFYSTNPDKSFPQTVDEVKAAVSDKVSAGAIQRGIERYQRAGFGEEFEQPRDRFFDCLYRLSSRRKDRSDYDFQVSSDKLIARFEELERRDPRGGFRSSPEEGGPSSRQPRTSGTGLDHGHVRLVAA